MLIQRCTPDIKKHIDGSSYQPLFNHFTPKCDSFFSSLAAWLHIFLCGWSEAEKSLQFTKERKALPQNYLLCFYNVVVLSCSILYFELFFLNFKNENTQRNMNGSV